MTTEDELFRSAKLGVVIPEATNSSIAEVLAFAAENDEEVSDSMLPGVKQRSLLFFDERLTAYLILEFPVTANDVLKRALPRLDLKLACVAVSAEANENEPGKAQDSAHSAKDTISNQPVQNVGDPYIAIGGEAEDGTTMGFAIWEVEVTLNRPRSRIPSPAIIFSPSGVLRSGMSTPERTEEDLPPFEPMPVNILAPYKADPSMREDAPFLSTATLQRILPDSAPSESVVYLQPMPSEAIRIITAVSARVRYSRMNTFARGPRTIASIDFEVTPFIRFDAELDVAEVTLSDQGIIEPIAPMSLPAICRPRDGLTLLYTLLPSERPQEPNITTATVHILDIRLSTRLLVSDICKPRITMRWKTNVDFTVPLNPSYGAPSQLLQRTNRPTSLATLSATPTIASPTSLTGPSGVTSMSPDTSLTISFSAPTTEIQVGSTFSWNVLIVNHSPRARKLAIVAITTRNHRGSIPSNPVMSPQKDLTARHAPKLSTTSQVSMGSVDRTTGRPPSQHASPSGASAFVDENILYALQHSAGNNTSSKSTTLICMSPDIRIGPLAQNGAHETEMKFLAIRPGWARVEGVRIVDLGAAERISLASQNPINATGEPGSPVEWIVRDLPDVWVVDSDDDNDVDGAVA